MTSKRAQDIDATIEFLDKYQLRNVDKKQEINFQRIRDLLEFLKFDEAESVCRPIDAVTLVLIVTVLAPQYAGGLIENIIESGHFILKKIGCF